MKYKTTVVTLPELRLVVRQATEFPQGIKAAWQELEAPLTTLRGRKFYGLTYAEESGLVYYAGLEPQNEAEITRLGLPTLSIPGGDYARVKLMDWSNHTDEIGPIFDELMRHYEMKPGPTIEFYRSQTELHLLIPVSETSVDRSELLEE